MNVKTIIQSKVVLGHHLQFLAKNPSDFLELAKIDHELALQYALNFSAGHVLTLLSTADEQGIKIIAEMIQFEPPIPEGYQPHWGETTRLRFEKTAFIDKTAETLLEKLDSSIFIAGENNVKRNVLDQHFQPSIFSRLLPCTQNDFFKPLIARNNYHLIGNIINLLSPKIAMRELQRIDHRNFNLLSLIFDSKEIAALKHTLNKMAELSTPLFEILMPHFNFDVLKYFDTVSKQLAEQYYLLAPGFMQKQYPVTAVDYLDIPPPYDVKPAYNPALT